MKILKNIKKKSQENKKSLAVLVDPDKITTIDSLNYLLEIGLENCIDYFFVGGSLITSRNLHEVILKLKTQDAIPVIIFPGSNMQIDPAADGILFLSLISGRNPDLLIGQHVVAAPVLKQLDLEVLPTGYMLISKDHQTSVAYMSNTIPIPPDKSAIASSTALAGEMLGMQCIYMDAGSGAEIPVPEEMIRQVKKCIKLPLIIGGGINSVSKAQNALSAGADIIVIGNAIEKNPDLLIGISECVYEFNKSLDIH
ncbi:MAG: geranylgeranylglyceryl/heptaprenylglyceryl phosphate synthase [Candidatus Cyclobacteriaceae bacterium M2_1C_046]